MSLIFEASNVFAKTLFGEVFLRVHDSTKQSEKSAEPIGAIEASARIACGMGHSNSVSMNYDDFCDLAIYVLTNEDLHPNDVRLKFIERIKRHEIVKGWSPEQKRLHIPGEEEPWKC